MAVWLKNGTRSDEVRDVQNRLNSAGYNVTVDGYYGPQTEKAVRDYQSKNGLTVDGIVGDKTYGSLSGTKAQGASTSSTGPLTGVSQPTQDKLKSYSDGYKPSDTVSQAEQLLNEQINKKPGAYKSPYSDQIQDVYEKIMGRKDFSYDLNGDMLYQQYKDQYVNLGRLAMEDTMGQAAGLTGGYGSTYSESVGQQAYNAYLQQLNDKVPELYQLALSRYQAQGDDLYKQLSAAQGLEDSAYGRYRDTLSDYYNDLNLAYNRYTDERNFDYNDYSAMLNYWQNQAAREQEQANWQSEMDFEREQYEYAKSKAASSGGRSGGSSSGGSSSSSVRSSSTNALTEEQWNASRRNSIATGNFTSAAKYATYDDYLAAYRLGEVGSETSEAVVSKKASASIYNDIDEDLHMFQTDGIARSRLRATIDEEYAAGNISAEQRKTLLKKYC